MKYTTIKDIANELGISKSTVSRALNGDTLNVSKHTRQLIMDTATRMGYRRNEMAVNLRSRSSHVVGIIVPEITTPFSMSFISAVQKQMRRQGYSVSIAFSDEKPAIERANLEMFNKTRVDGILISAAHNTANLDIYQTFLNQRIPLVFFDRTITDIPVPCVKSNDYIKSFFLVEHLIYSGKRKILHLAGPGHIQNAIDRRSGWRDALEKFNIPYSPHMSVTCGVKVADGAKAIEDALARGLEFDSVFCFTETQALGAKSCLQEHNFRIPDDIAICCMSGTELSTLVYPRITAVEQQVDEMARIASDLLMEKIRDFASPDRTIVINSNMVVRGSTAGDETND
ncbi:MAG: LacI family transcriptional regulator, partial [Muribaculaceae bacterium]|nr:LacI family transcriptional regulator [Muribaculaceae bacterium]